MDKVTGIKYKILWFTLILEGGRARVIKCLLVSPELWELNILYKADEMFDWSQGFWLNCIF